MNWVFNLIFLATTWNGIDSEKDVSSESLFFPELDEIESFLKNSYENSSYRESFDDGRLRLKENPLEDLSYRHHGSHPANIQSWKLQCVWNAINSGAPGRGRESKNDTTSIKSKIVPECNNQAWEDCGVDFTELSCDLKAEYRTINGTCNNLIHTRWGAAPRRFERFLHSDYCNRVDSFRCSYEAKSLPNARKISRALSNSTKAATPEVTLMLMQWGQFIDHDITLTPERETDKELRAKYTEYDEIWTFRQCNYGSLIFHWSKNVVGCIIKCDETPGCTAFIYNSNTGCYLIYCDVPIPTPTWRRYPHFKGYARNADPEESSSTLECCDRGLYNNSVSLWDDCVPINVTGDSFYEKDPSPRECLRFVRSMPASDECPNVGSPMQQINQNTAFVDGSMVYGSDAEVANFVRTHHNGSLNISRSVQSGKSLPPRGGIGTAHKCPIESEETCFLAGDIRVDEVPGLTAMHTIFIRLHNVIAIELCNNVNHNWCRNDEKLFQETRRIVIALIQQITYGEWLPHVVGQNLMDKYHLNIGGNGYRDTYNATVNATISNVFATAAFRFGHSLIDAVIKTAVKGNTRPYPGNFFNNELLKDTDTSPLSLLKGMSRCPSAPMDAIVATPFTNSLYADHPSGPRGIFFGLDLLAINIQRGRDHGIPGYTEWRTFCGLEPVTEFSQLYNYMPSDLVESFELLYQNVRDIDLFPAGLAEHPIADGILGPTFSCIIARQFAHIKHGDRFWYERENQPKPFTPDQLASIRSQKLVSILCKVSEHAPFRFQPKLFSIENERSNAVANCSTYNFINLQLWKVCPEGYSVVAGKCYFFSKTHELPRRSWSDARSFCQSRSNRDYNVDLIVLENFTTLQEDPVLNYMYTQGMWYTWFGATFSPSSNTWSWLDGRSFTSNSSMWSPGQPNDEGNSNCAAFGSQNLPYFSMFDIPCSWTRDYACQIHPLA